MEKGQKLDLTKLAPGASKFILGLGWDPRKSSSPHDFDLDAFAVICGEGRVYQDMVYFGQKQSNAGGFVSLDGDNLTGAGDGPDENVTVDTSKWPVGCTEVLVGCNIYKCHERSQNFGQVDNAFIQIETGGQKLANFDLTEDGSTMTYYVLGRLYQHNGSVKFEATGKGGNKPSLNEIANDLINL
jgi:tellurium resistance protein TerD